MSRYMIEGASRDDYRNQGMAVSHSRGEQLRQYWRAVKAAAALELSAADARRVLDSLYEATFARVRR